MSITLFQVDKSGSDPFDKDYSIVLVVNKELVYGINIPQYIKDNLTYKFKQGELKINHGSEKKAKNRFRLRFHTSVVIKLLEKALKDLGFVDRVNFEICNDFDGHFHEIKDMIFKHISRLIPSLRLDDIILAKFSKPSLIDDAGRNFRKKDKESTKSYSTISLDLDELTNMIKK